LYDMVRRMAELPDVRAAVEANHDENRWWPTSIADPRMRMLAAGWSTRVSYSMVDTYAEVVRTANRTGFETLLDADDQTVTDLVRPIGLPAARITYLRSLGAFLDWLAAQGIDPLTGDPTALIGQFAGDVRQASFKVAQCAVLYARGYHCGIIPVDSGMVRKLAPLLGLPLPTGPIAHERMRLALEAEVTAHLDAYRRLPAEFGYAVTVPATAAPTWWTHLVLIYFKRLYLNRPGPRLCPRRPACATLVDCPHTGR
jgi:hypothetical protein